jgi:hypothetical protein
MLTRLAKMVYNSPNMKPKSYTREEKYLIEAHVMAEERLSSDEELTDVEINRYDVGLRARINPKGVDSIVAQMVRGNLLRKRGEENVQFTRTGREVALELIKNAPKG